MQQLDQDGPRTGPLVLTESGSTMCPFNGRWSGEMLMTQKLRDQAGHETEHISAFGGFRDSEEAEVGGPAPVLQVINFVQEVGVIGFQLFHTSGDIT